MSYKWWLIIAILLFCGSLALGLASPYSLNSFLAEQNASLKEFANLLMPLPQSSVVQIIFIKNAVTLVLSFAFSPIFCLMPLMALTVNGSLLGLVSATVIKEKSLGYLLAGIIPHGIFELPAFIIGEAAALNFGTAVILALFIRKRREMLPSNLKRSIKYLALAFALLIPAAFIETYITPLLLR